MVGNYGHLVNGTKDPLKLCDSIAALNIETNNMAQVRTSSSNLNSVGSQAGALSAKNAWPRARHRSRQFRRPAEKDAFVTGPPRTRFSAHIAERFTFIGNCQLLRVVCKASQFQAQFTLREKANNDRFFATVRRAAKEQSAHAARSWMPLFVFKKSGPTFSSY